MKKVIVTGAAGFAGANLTEALSEKGYKVYAMTRPSSPHNSRIERLKNVEIIELDLNDIYKLPDLVNDKCDTFFHLGWIGADRMDFERQYINVNIGLESIKVAQEMGCKRWICTGSQAEYGVRSDVQYEDLMPNPFNAYGVAKVTLCYMSRYYTKQHNVDWVWGRIYSLYGKYEPSGRMLPDLIAHLKAKEPVSLSSCTQYWNYLDAEDAADALIALSENGHSGEIYNIASNTSLPLKEYVKIMIEMYGTNSIIQYGPPPYPFVSLRPSIHKIIKDTGWTEKKSFKKGLHDVYG